MARDASLDEFLDVDPDGEHAGDADGEETGRRDPAAASDAESRTADGTDAGSPADGAADPVRPVAQWRPNGAACGACGAMVERRWRDEDCLVCGECYDW